MNANTWSRLRHVLGGYPTSAKEWAVRVQSSDVSRRELLALEQWLRAAPANAEAYARMNKIGHLGLLLRDHPDQLAELTSNPQWQLPARAERTATWKWVAASVAVASLAAIAVFVDLPFKPHADAQYVAGRGEQRQVVLLDGSRITVNTESEVRVNYSAKERLVELSQGEAFFDVAKDAERPFLVRTGSVEVRAIGTRFSVRKLDADVEVVVAEGRVQVRREVHDSGESSSPTAVSAGQSAHVGAVTQPVRVAAVDALRATAWTSGFVQFDDATLTDVIRDVNRYTHKPFVVEGDDLNDIRFTGRFQVGDVQMVKFALKDRFDIDSVEEAGSIRLVRAK